MERRNFLKGLSAALGALLAARGVEAGAKAAKAHTAGSAAAGEAIGVDPAAAGGETTIVASYKVPEGKRAYSLSSISVGDPIKEMHTDKPGRWYKSPDGKGVVQIDQLPARLRVGAVEMRPTSPYGDTWEEVDPLFVKPADQNVLIGRATRSAKAGETVEVQVLHPMSVGVGALARVDSTMAYCT